VDGQIYTPVDTTSYDEVGYAAPGNMGGAGITAAHKTLPLPSYVEVTSLVTGKTILARVERRGPMTGDRLISLSQDAQTQLGSEDGTPVRVRRVNPPEIERAQLRMGQSVSERMATPQSLVAVLKRKLPEHGSVNLGSPDARKTGATSTEMTEIAAISVPPSNAVPTSKPLPLTETEPVFDSASNPQASAPTDYALASPDASTPEVTKPEIVATSQPEPKPEATPKPAPTSGKFVIQAAAFSNKISAQKVASTLGGFIQPSGKYFRVRVGPFSNRGQADAALAKVRAAGYSDARVSTAG
jgi:rare lipoprotein A